MLVMLDLDNTLLDRQAAVAAWIEEFTSEQALPLGAPDWILARDRDGYADRTTFFEAIRMKFGLDPPIDTLLAAYQKRVVELSGLTPGAQQCLRLLRSAGYRLAIVSNGSSAQQHAKIEALGLRSLVDAVIVSGDLGVHKPDARAFQAAAASTSSTLEGAWMVGDSPVHDIIGGHRCGARTAWLHRGRSWTETEVQPTATIASLEELVPVILAAGTMDGPRSEAVSR